VLQCRGATKPANKIIAGLGLPSEDAATFGWRYGMWQWLRIETEWQDEYGEEGKLEPLELARRLFAMPTCAALEELRIGMLQWDDNDELVPEVLAEAGKHAWASGLHRLHLGDLSGDVDMAHHRVGTVGKLISKAFPALRWLKIHSGTGWGDTAETGLGVQGLDLPELTELTIETCSLSSKRLKHLLAAKLPKVEKLELWFGSENYGADCKVRDLEPLLAGKAFPKVRHLGLRNAEATNDIAAALPGSAIARRLATLDLSMGTLTGAGARALADGAARFAALEKLDVDDNFLDPAALRTLATAFGKKRVHSTTQKQPDGSIDGETHYYVSVSE
jgi:hypothetical protein